MLKTNCKKAMENIKKEIIDAYESAEEYYIFNGREAKKEYNDICKDIMNAFYIEKVKYDCRRMSRQELFIDWMSGLPTAFPVSDEIYLRSASDWVGKILEQAEEEKEKFTEEESEKLACCLLFRELEKHASKAK